MWTILIACVFLFAGLTTLAWKKPGWAIALLPLTAGAPTVAGIIGLEEHGEGMFIIPIVGGIVLFFITVILVCVKPLPDHDDEPWYKVVSKILFTLIAALCFLAILTGIFQAFGPVLFILFLILWFRFKRTRRYSLSLTVLSTLSAAMRQNLPLPMALETAGSNRKDPAANIYRQTAQFLCEGKSLSESLRKAYRKCPAEILATLAAGEAMNQLPQAAAALEQDSLANINGFEKVRPVHPAYPLLVGGMTFLIMLGLCVFILPTFAEVLYNTTGGEGQLPASTQALLAISKTFMERGVFALASGALLVGMLIGLYGYNRPRRPGRPRLLSRASDWLKWHTPVVRSFERLRSMQRTIEGLRVGLKAGYSFDTIVRHTLGLDVNLCYQARLRRWLGQIEAGLPIAESAAACGLGTTLAWALDEKVNKGNTPDLLAMLEEVTRNRYHYRLNIFHSILWPFVVVGLGGGVGFVVYAMFAATVSLITHTMDYSMP